MAFTRSPIFRLVVALTVLAIPVSAFAAGHAVGKPSSSISAIDWQVSASNYEAIELTVSAPNGETYKKTFSAGRTPSFRVSDLGSDLADGTYNYQLRVVPKVSGDLKKKLDKARGSGDEAAARKIAREAGLSAPEQSGAFTIRNGSIVSPDEVETDANARSGGRQITTDAVVKPKLNPVALDQVIPDDLIVQGSGCFGFDCVNNESFGFDTIRMKENNTRIKFEDTSVGSFPTNDWQLTANDSASGGSSKFSIEDITGAKVPFTITAGASTNSIFVDSTGRVGFRTSTPVLDLHISTSNTPAIRLEQTNAQGFTAQTWDIAGNEANFFVRDVTSGSRLPFRIRPGAPTSSLDISADGDVGIGTASPDTNLHVEADANNPGNGNASILVSSAQNEDAVVGLGVSPSLSDGNADGFIFGYNGASGIGRGFIGTRPTTGTGQINFAVENITEMILTATGLEVTDAIRVGGVTMTVPDYVFDEGYELMPLDELAKFISSNKHLPEIPSEAEIKANGLDLGKFHMSLLKKVEELTLYTLSQQETIKTLESRLAQIEQKN
jgi:hypothetical protein